MKYTPTTASMIGYKTDEEKREELEKEMNRINEINHKNAEKQHWTRVEYIENEKLKLANEKIKKLEKQYQQSQKTQKRQYVITTIISICSLLVAFGSIFIAIFI